MNLVGEGYGRTRRKKTITGWTQSSLDQEVRRGKIGRYHYISLCNQGRTASRLAHKAEEGAVFITRNPKKKRGEMDETTTAGVDVNNEFWGGLPENVGGRQITSRDYLPERGTIWVDLARERKKANKKGLATTQNPGDDRTGGVFYERGVLPDAHAKRLWSHRQ